MYLDNVRVNGILLKDRTDFAYKYMLGLLNSSLLHWFFSRLATPFANGWLGANRQFIEPLPIRLIDRSISRDRKMEKELIDLVEKMLILQKKIQETAPESGEEKHDLKRQIQLMDSEIDTVVCNLYGLNKEDRKAIGIPEPA